MTIHAKKLQAHIQHRDLLCIRRAGIDEFSMQGVLLSFSESLLLFQYVFDFHLDGYLLLRQSDISELSSRDTDRFQRELLQTEGIFEQIDFGFRAPIQDYEAFLASRSKEEIVIVEDEQSDPKEFLIGRVAYLEPGIVYVDHFTGTARRSESPAPLLVDRITSCRLGTNYARFYERHFARMTRSL